MADIKVTKIGHCCLRIELGGKVILTDPGNWSAGFENETGIDYIFITHEHGDHMHIEGIRQVMSINPNAQIVTNSGVKKAIEEAGMTAVVQEGEDEQEYDGLKVQSVDTEHGFIHEEIELPQNTGYNFSEKIFLPGDSYGRTDMKAEILALPVAGPWSLIGEAVNFARDFKPQLCFPIHDGMLKEFAPYHWIPQHLLEPKGIKFQPLLAGEELFC